MLEGFPMLLGDFALDFDLKLVSLIYANIFLGVLFSLSSLSFLFLIPKILGYYFSLIKG